MYMSPEALSEPPVYTEKLDSFSFGVLCVQIMIRQFPNPGDRFHIMVIDDPRIPSGRVEVDIPEIECRQSHIDLIDPAHPLLLVALDCLKDRESVLVKRRIWSTIKVKGRKKISLHKIKL